MAWSEIKADARPRRISAVTTAFHQLQPTRARWNMVPSVQTVAGRPVLVRRTTPYARSRPVPPIFQLLEADLVPVITDTVPQVISLIVTNRSAPTSPGNFSCVYLSLLAGRRLSRGELFHVKTCTSSHQRTVDINLIVTQAAAKHGFLSRGSNFVGDL